MTGLQTEAPSEAGGLPLCPFAHAGPRDDIVFDRVDRRGGGRSWWFAHCMTCHATGPQACTREEAARLWEER